MSASQTEILILVALEHRELYGREIVESIAESGRALKKGTLYTTLHRMKQKGLVTARWGPDDEVVEGARRKYYRITAQGDATLDEIRRALIPVSVGLRPALEDI